MITGLVLSNLLYPVVAVAVAILIALVVVARHGRPRSVEDNMKIFHRGMSALAPEDAAEHGPAPIRVSPQPRATSNIGGNGRVGSTNNDATSSSEADAG